MRVACLIQLIVMVILLMGLIAYQIVQMVINNLLKQILGFAILQIMEETMDNVISLKHKIISIITVNIQVIVKIS